MATIGKSAKKKLMSAQRKVAKGATKRNERAKGTMNTPKKKPYN